MGNFSSCSCFDLFFKFINGNNEQYGLLGPMGDKVSMEGMYLDCSITKILSEGIIEVQFHANTSGNFIELHKGIRIIGFTGDVKQLEFLISNSSKNRLHIEKDCGYIYTGHLYLTINNRSENVLDWMKEKSGEIASSNIAKEVSSMNSATNIHAVIPEAPPLGDYGKPKNTPTPKIDYENPKNTPMSKIDYENPKNTSMSKIDYELAQSIGSFDIIEDFVPNKSSKWI